MKNDRVNPHKPRGGTSLGDYKTVQPLHEVDAEDQVKKRKISVSKIKKIKRTSSVMGVETLGGDLNNTDFDGKITTVIDKSLFSSTNASIRLPSSSKNNLNSTMDNS